MNVETIIAAQGLQVIAPPAPAGSTVTVVLPPGATGVGFASTGGVANFQGNADGSLAVILDGNPGNATISWVPAGADPSQGYHPQMSLQISGSSGQKLNPVGPGGSVRINPNLPPIRPAVAGASVGLSATAKIAIGAGVVAAGVGGVAAAGIINQGNAGHYFGIAAESAVGAVMEARRRARKL